MIVDTTQSKLESSLTRLRANASCTVQDWISSATIMRLNIGEIIEVFSQEGIHGLAKIINYRVSKYGNYKVKMLDNSQEFWAWNWEIYPTDEQNNELRYFNQKERAMIVDTTLTKAEQKTRLANINHDLDDVKMPECSMDDFKTIVQRYVNGDPHVYPADDPSDPSELRVGFITDEPEQKVKYYCQSLSKVKKLYFEEWHQCVAKKIIRTSAMKITGETELC